MKKWIISTCLILFTVIAIAFSASSLFITYVPRIAPHTEFEVCDEKSIYNAMLSAQDSATSQLSSRYSEAIGYVSVLALLNALIAATLIIKGGYRAKST